MLANASKMGVYVADCSTSDSRAKKIAPSVWLNWPVWLQENEIY